MPHDTHNIYLLFIGQQNHYTSQRKGNEQTSAFLKGSRFVWSYLWFLPFQVLPLIITNIYIIIPREFFSITWLFFAVVIVIVVVGLSITFYLCLVFHKLVALWSCVLVYIFLSAVIKIKKTLSHKCNALFRLF